VISENRQKIEKKTFDSEASNCAHKNGQKMVAAKEISAQMSLAFQNWIEKKRFVCHKKTKNRIYSSNFKKYKFATNSQFGRNRFFGRSSFGKKNPIFTVTKNRCRLLPVIGFGTFFPMRIEVMRRL
jgi:hypothetical protein